MSTLKQAASLLINKGPRDFCLAGLRRLVAALDHQDPQEANLIEPAWSEYLSWLSFAVPGMLSRGNVDAMSFALRHLPTDAPMLEIGSFCGLSTCVLSYFKEKYSLPNAFYTCDRWNFEGQITGQTLGDAKVITHDEYRRFVRESFLRNVTTFCKANAPHTVEADSDTFFECWKSAQKMNDVFGRTVRLGGPLSFCYIDGNHTYTFAKRDFDNTDRFLVSGGYILFDDSADNSGWEVCKVVKEMLASGGYRLVTKNPNYLVQKK